MVASKVPTEAKKDTAAEKVQEVAPAEKTEASSSEAKKLGRCHKLNEA